ncbi:1-deoxy-D-xylulose-5-phosphate synthase [Spongiibacter nanhainus]|uniref:1-deoxy-D-xylulose-5-phosphate synthase n=1 Tax=Spongiibacter nanhainus TaxID=2794344 RepID=A0A7T4R1B5_9GAMM|nr:1-deoxy-D-xylulose-5-phosphate synthase [Spongiibacter nanhainus]QQD18631.1 1-deoxy-D-xylulose-5-phosphate synthase [Spongiibacter nanhainus]
MFKEIPLHRPTTPLLDTVASPADLRQLDVDDLPQLAHELREFLLYTVGQTGGHFGAGLGVVELTLALHYVYNTPNDRLVWDVGHQCYPHKILTGRRERMGSMRQGNGLAGFPKRDESEYDTFGVGHSSTSISAALGMAIAARQQQLDRHTVAVIGDGAMTAGMAFEAINHAAHTRANMLVVLNDNQMSISKNTGGLNTYFSKIWASKTYNQIRDGGKSVLSKLPRSATEIVARLEEYMKGMVSPAPLFEELGFNYIGPIDGHDLDMLVPTLRNIRELEGPQMLHIMTQKGKGFAPAEADPVGFHAIAKIEPKKGPASTKPKKPKYQDIFGAWLCDEADRDDKLVAITPAMCEGSGMVTFAKQFPERFYDVAIAEQHALTLAAGMACDGLKPVVAIYSTFLQRAYDQLIHDIALQNLDVVFGIDRAGLVGEDGPTHSGAFDLSYLRCIPNMVVMAPSDENETRQMLHTGYQYPGPAAVRYPRGTGPGVELVNTLTAMEIGKGLLRREGREVAILNFGSLLTVGLSAAENLDASVADMRFVKPLDTALIDQLADGHQLLVTLEENVVAGGAGSAVVEYLNQQGRSVPVLQLGLPDRFVDHGNHGEQLASVGLSAEGIEQQIRQRLAALHDPRAVISSVK